MVYGPQSNGRTANLSARHGVRCGGRDVDATAQLAGAHASSEEATARGYRVVHPRGCGVRRAYVPRQPERTVLHRVVREHLETFLAEARHRGGGEGLPLFVERELREFLTCGVLARGFARFRCESCRPRSLSHFPVVRSWKLSAVGGLGQA